MKDFFKNMKFDIKCPACSNSIKVNATDVGSTITCPHCNQSIELHDNNFSNNLNDANKALNDFSKDLKKLFK